LRPELKKVIVPMCIREFPALVDKVNMVKTLEKGDSRVMRSDGGGSTRGKTRA